MKLDRSALLKTTFFIITYLIAGSCWAQGKGMVNFESSYSVAETEKRLIQILNNKGFKIFSQINHSDGAKVLNINLPETRVVIFGKPQIGSRLMQCSPSVAIDLPQKMLIWEENNQVRLAFNSPKFLQKRHQMNDCETLLKKISGALNKIAKKVTSAK